MRVVVTGGAGFIGANLCRALVASDAIGAITVLDDLSSGRRENLAGLPGVELVEASILDRDALAGAARGATSVVHLAARPSVARSLEDPIATHEANATGTLLVLEAARAAGVAQVIVASSSSVYGRNATLPSAETHAPAPASPYAASKLAAESYALAWQRSFGISVLALRFFNVFGPLQPAGHAYAAVIPAFGAAALTGRPLPLEGDGNQTRDFTYVGSVAALLLEAVERGVSADGPVNLAFGSRRSLRDVIATLESLLGRPLALEHRPPRPGDVPHSQADTAKLRALFPGARPVPFEDGLAETLHWLRGELAASGGRDRAGSGGANAPGGVERGG